MAPFSTKGGVMPSSGSKIAWVNDGTKGIEVLSEELEPSIPSASGEIYDNVGCLLCTNSFAIWGRRFYPEIYAYNPASGSWETLFAKPTYYINSYQAITVNFDISRLPNGSPSLLSSLGTSHIHFAVILGGIRSYRGEVHAVMGSYLTMPQSNYNTYAKGKHIYGKKGTAVADSFRLLGHWTPDMTAEDLNWLAPDPFQTDWGDITSARGQQILATQAYRLVAFEF